jgi:hypothetical protein
VYVNRFHHAAPLVGGGIKDTKKGIDGVREDEAVGLAARPSFVY